MTVPFPRAVSVPTPNKDSIIYDLPVSPIPSLRPSPASLCSHVSLMFWSLSCSACDRWSPVASAFSPSTLTPPSFLQKYPHNSQMSNDLVSYSCTQIIHSQVSSLALALVFFFFFMVSGLHMNGTRQAH